MDNDGIFKLFAPCIPVNGFSRSLICDVYRGRFRYIPNALYYILTKLQNKTVSQIKNYFGNENDDIIDEYIEFLIKNEFGTFLTAEEAKRFPKLSLEFEVPYNISNAIIDINKNSDHNYKNIIDELFSLHCYYYELRFYDKMSNIEIKKILDSFNTGLCKSINLIIAATNEINSKFLKFLFDNYPIAQMHLHSFLTNDKKNIRDKLKNYPITISEVQLYGHQCCGNINLRNFNTNVQLFNESNQFNSCLNRKIGISSCGKIKNCPSMNQIYGRVGKQKIKDIIHSAEFQKIWNISKDKINVCKDCEYRYICIDCRAFIDDPSDPYSKPLKCGYNPYTNKWESWSLNPLKMETIKYYKLKEVKSD